MRLAAPLAAVLVPVLAYAQAPERVQCMLDVEIGGRCASDWMIRAVIVSAAIVLVGIVWRSLTARAGVKDWHDEQQASEHRAAALGDLGRVAAADPAKAAHILQRQLGTGALEYAKRERHRAFQQGDIATAGAWQDVERLIERQSGAD